MLTITLTIIGSAAVGMFLGYQLRCILQNEKEAEKELGFYKPLKQSK